MPEPRSNDSLIAALGAELVPVRRLLPPWLRMLGWLALVAVVPLWYALTPAGFAWLLAGGACYTLGIVFYAADHRVRHAHGLWHLFVLGGSICHFFAVFFYVA